MPGVWAAVEALVVATGRELRVREQSPEAARRAYAAVLGPDYADAALAARHHRAPHIFRRRVLE